MGVSITKRPCKIGSSLNGRTEHHGDESVPGADLTVSNILLEKEELNQLLESESAWKSLYKSGKMPEPMFPKLVAFKFRDKFEKSACTLYLGLDNEKVTLNGIKLSKITLQPMPGGLTALSVQIQCTPDADQVGLIMTHLDSDGACSIRFGKIVTKDVQPELPLDATKAEGEDDNVPGPLEEGEGAAAHWQLLATGLKRLAGVDRLSCTKAISSLRGASDRADLDSDCGAVRAFDERRSG